MRAKGKCSDRSSLCNFIVFEVGGIVEDGSQVGKVLRCFRFRVVVAGLSFFLF